MASPRDKLDVQAKRELDEEAERHRRALEHVSARDTAALVAEANLHFDQVKEIMRALVRRNPPDVM
jgi:DNA-binding GntR family transcriptional regulator